LSSVERGLSSTSHRPWRWSPNSFNGVYGASKAYVLTFTRSLNHELAGKGVRVQVVVPGAAATDFWTDTGVSVGSFPESFVMSAEDVVDAALAGLESGEVITIPSLPNMADWEAYEAAGKAMGPNLSRSTPLNATKSTTAPPKRGTKIMTTIDNKVFVLEAFDALFNKRDYEAAAKFWSPNYIQHSATSPPVGTDCSTWSELCPRDCATKTMWLWPTATMYSLTVAFPDTGDRGPGVAADMCGSPTVFWAEHWDVLQDEATREESASGLPMFGASFAEQTTVGTPLTVDQARTIVAPFYDALKSTCSKRYQCLTGPGCPPGLQVVSYQRGVDYAGSVSQSLQGHGSGCS